MTPETVVAIGQQALEVIMALAAPILVSALVVGLLVGVLQAATQIQEMTLSFIPKLLAVALALMVASGWMLQVIMDFTTGLYDRIPNLVG